MKTYCRITYARNGYENSQGFIRPRSATTPTHAGAARMIARDLSERYGRNVHPNEISILRIQETDYQTR